MLRSSLSPSAAFDVKDSAPPHSRSQTNRTVGPTRIRADLIERYSNPVWIMGAGEDKEEGDVEDYGDNIPPRPLSDSPTEEECFNFLSQLFISSGICNKKRHGKYHRLSKTYGYYPSKRAIKLLRLQSLTPSEKLKALGKMFSIDLYWDSRGASGSYLIESLGSNFNRWKLESLLYYPFLFKYFHYNVGWKGGYSLQFTDNLYYSDILFFLRAKALNRHLAHAASQGNENKVKEVLANAVKQFKEVDSKKDIDLKESTVSFPAHVLFLSAATNKIRHLLLDHGMVVSREWEEVSYRRGALALETVEHSYDFCRDLANKEMTSPGIINNFLTQIVEDMVQNKLSTWHPDAIQRIGQYSNWKDRLFDLLCIKAGNNSQIFKNVLERPDSTLYKIFATRRVCSILSSRLFPASNTFDRIRKRIDKLDQASQLHPAPEQRRLLG